MAIQKDVYNMYIYIYIYIYTLQGTNIYNISPKNGSLKMIFLFPRWDMLIPWRVYNYIYIYVHILNPLSGLNLYTDF